MSDRTKKWIKGIVAAFVGGGAAAVTSGLTGMGFAPDKFNLTTLVGVGHLLGLMAANFLVSGVMSIFFYLRQSPVPPDSNGDSNPKAFVKSEQPTEPTSGTGIPRL